MSTAHETMRRLGVDLPNLYAALCPPLLAHLAVEIDAYNPVLDVLDTAIQRKADLSLVWPRWALWLFDVELVQYKNSVLVAALFRRWCAGDRPSVVEWDKTAAKVVRVEALWAAAVASAAASPRWAANVVAKLPKKLPDSQNGLRYRMTEKLKQLLDEAQP